MVSWVSSITRLLRRRRSDSEAVRAPVTGIVYRSPSEPGPDEYAEVIDLRRDDTDIQHVRFRLVLGYRDKVVEAGERTLAAPAFAQRFPERVGPADQAFHTPEA